MIVDSLVFSGAALGIGGALCLSASRAWARWLELKKMELNLRAGAAAGEFDPAVRIELASIRNRLRKLEAIASGVDL